VPAIGNTSRCVQCSGVPFSAGFRQRQDWNRSAAGDTPAFSAGAEGVPPPLDELLLKLESNAILQRTPGALFFRGDQRDGVAFRS
jgi:hypothetical protein